MTRGRQRPLAVAALEDKISQHSGRRPAPHFVAQSHTPRNSCVRLVAGRRRRLTQHSLPGRLLAIPGLMTRVAMSPINRARVWRRSSKPTLVRRAMATVADAEDHRRGIEWCFSSAARVWNKNDVLESRRMRVTASAAIVFGGTEGLLRNPAWSQSGLRRRFPCRRTQINCRRRHFRPIRPLRAHKLSLQTTAP